MGIIFQVKDDKEKRAQEQRIQEQRALYESYRKVLLNYEELLKSHEQNEIDIMTASKNMEGRVSEVYDVYKEKLDEYKIPLGEIQNTLERYENQLEINADQVKKYELGLHRYHENIVGLEEQFNSKFDEKNEEISSIVKKIDTSTNMISEKILEGNRSILTKVETEIGELKTQNKRIKLGVSFLVFFNILTLVGIGILLFQYLL